MPTSVGKGTLVYKDATNRGRAKMVFRGANATSITKAKMIALAAVFAAHTDCVATQECFLDIQREDPASGAGNKDRKGIITAQEANGSVHRWELPGILASDCEINPNTNGEFIQPAVAATLVDAIETATGLTLDPLPCPVIQTT